MHYENLARPAGLEPTTPWFVARCSNPTELRARESELYQKLDEAYPAKGPHGRWSLQRPHLTGTLYALYLASDGGCRDLRQSDVGKCSIYGSCCRVSAASAKRRSDQQGQEDEAVEGQMSATLQRAASATAANRANKIGIK